MQGRDFPYRNARCHNPHLVGSLYGSKGESANNIHFYLLYPSPGALHVSILSLLHLEIEPLQHLSTTSGIFARILQCGDHLENVPSQGSKLMKTNLLQWPLGRKLPPSRPALTQWLSFDQRGAWRWGRGSVLYASKSILTLYQVVSRSSPRSKWRVNIFSASHVSKPTGLVRSNAHCHGVISNFLYNQTSASCVPTGSEPRPILLFSRSALVK